ncbi:MAG: GNAT family N-acetyltransferase [Alphaproteobacteria bacterium]|nr:GNAT family N-acetyltransferase [Alphaproteobacteria bacterium]
MEALHKGKYVLRLATQQSEIKAAQKLRFSSFRAGQSGEMIDRDRFDDTCQHVLIHHAQSNELVCCFRMMSLSCGQDIDQSYSAQFYDLSALKSFPAPMLEIGRFCIKSGRSDPNIVRLAWSALTGFVDKKNVELLFGCSSFTGLNAAKYHEAFGYLHQNHLAPTGWAPLRKAQDIIPLYAEGHISDQYKFNNNNTIPPLLRAYLSMGGWVSDHAVVDQDLDSLHVFTGLIVKSVPRSRAKSLRSLNSPLKS